MITNGSKIELVYPMGEFDNVGEVCEVIKVTEDGVISFKFGNGMHLGCMSFNEYEKYFKPYEEPIPVKRDWSDWKRTAIGYTNMNDEVVKEYIQYRNNGLRVQVRTMYEENNLKARSSCYKSDSFDEIKGLNLAISRLVLKIHAREVNEMAKNM